MSSKESLAEFLKEVSNWDWAEFVQAEHDNGFSTRQSVIFSLIRACAMEKLDAIKISLDRLDGKLKTPVKIEYPKMFFVYPKATRIEGGDMTVPVHDGSTAVMIPSTTEQNNSSELIEGEVLEPEDLEWIDEDNYTDLPSLSLRQTLEKMMDAPRQIPDHILNFQQQIEEHYRGQATTLPFKDDRPAVKSVIAAHLLKMAQNRKIDALYEVFDQIDGKLVETIQVLGEGGDVLIPIYTEVAPAGAYLNSQGMLQLEATQPQELWTAKFKEKR